jgi:hypothetical protein
LSGSLEEWKIDFKSLEEQLTEARASNARLEEQNKKLQSK